MIQESGGVSYSPGHARRHMKLSPMPMVAMGEEAWARLEGIAGEWNLRRWFVVTGPHVSRIPAFGRAMDALVSKGREVEVWDRVEADPTIEQVEEASRAAREFGAEAVVGLGGGSPLDSAKIVSAALGNPEGVETFLGADQVKRPGAPLVAIPTTAGTGSEATNISILTDTAARMKVAAVSDHLVPRAALLMPEMTADMPPRVAAATGMDALCHAAEAYLSVRRNPYSDALALKAIRLIGTHLVRAQGRPGDAEARAGMQLAALLAGLAFNNSSVTAVHAFAYPLGGMFHVPHGLANSMMAEAVFRHNLPGSAGRMAELGEALAGVRAPEALLEGIRGLRKGLGLPTSLREAGIPEESIPEMAKSVMGVARLLSVNPAPIHLEDAVRIYREAYEGR